MWRKDVCFILRCCIGFYKNNENTGFILKVKLIIGQNSKEYTDCWSSPDGKFIIFKGEMGNYMIVSKKTKQWIGNLVMNSKGIGGCFSPDSKYFFSCGYGGEIYKWDMKQRRCVNRFVDYGSNSTNSISISKNGELLATG